jgi:predicted secreted protein
MVKESKGFDLSKYQIANQTRSVPIVIEETGDEFEITIKQLS